MALYLLIVLCLGFAWYGLMDCGWRVIALFYRKQDRFICWYTQGRFIAAIDPTPLDILYYNMED